MNKLSNYHKVQKVGQKPKKPKRESRFTLNDLQCGQRGRFSFNFFARSQGDGQIGP